MVSSGLAALGYEYINLGDDFIYFFRTFLWFFDFMLSVFDINMFLFLYELDDCWAELDRDSKVNLNVLFPV